MLISQRDREIVAFLGRFQQATADHIQRALFYGLASETPRDRALKRLMGDGLLTRIEHRLTGGAHGGSGQYVYMLDNIGLRLIGVDKRQRTGRPNYHALAVTEAYCALRPYVRRYLVEDDCWIKVKGEDIRPDMWLELDDMSIWLEVDLGTEGLRQLQGKLDTYARAYQYADRSDIEEFPRVVWFVPNEQRERELVGLIRKMDHEYQRLFVVTRVLPVEKW